MSFTFLKIGSASFLCALAGRISNFDHLVSLFGVEFRFCFMFFNSLSSVNMCLTDNLDFVDEKLFNSVIRTNLKTTFLWLHYI